MDVGVKINQYTVIEHIGRGGMADVWSARDQRLSRTVAIKTVGRDLSSETELDPVALFEREARTFAQLEHPYILPIYDFGDYASRLYIVMRFVTGGTIEDLLTAGPLPINEVIRLARSVGSALDHAHVNNVVHLDIKPSNILLDSNGSPYLADFGLAAVIEPSGRAANPGYGTLLYMAPEQLTDDSLDHRADIYSFCILVYHMLTGVLPFDSTTSLALKQLQFQDELPDIDAANPLLPMALTSILRRGTALRPEDRPQTIMEIVEQLEALLLPSGLSTLNTFPDAELEGETGPDIGSTVDLSNVVIVGATDALARSEAQDLYNRARRAWAHGQGRFLMGITHFMLVNDFYMQVEKNELVLDESGMQMLLRGALEYDYEIDFWWAQLDDDNRRWVTLHAIRSDNAPARERAFYRLETLPDSEPPKIPRLVAQAIEMETNEQAKSAAVHVLATRAQLQLDRADYDLMKKQVSGSMLTTRRRFTLQTSVPEFWREQIFSPDIDRMLGEIALDDSMPLLAEQAARSVGRIRSLAAVQYIAEAHRKGQKGALRALALVRDEAPHLPNVVSNQARLYAWLANTWRRLTINPMQAVWRYVCGFVGGFMALGGWAWLNLPSQAIFRAQTSGIAVSTGMVFGFFIGLLVVFSAELSERLQGFWPWWSRLALSLALGLLIGTGTWWAFTWFFLNYPPDLNVMLLGGAGLAGGFVLSSLLRLPVWAAVIVTVFSVFAPLYIAATDTHLTPILYFLAQDGSLDRGKMFEQGLFVAAMVGIWGHAPALWREARQLLKRLRP